MERAGRSPGRGAGAGAGPAGAPGEGAARGRRARSASARSARVRSASARVRSASASSARSARSACSARSVRSVDLGAAERARSPAGSQASRASRASRAVSQAASLDSAGGLSASPTASMAESAGSWISVSFQSQTEEERFRRVCRILGVVGYVYLFTGSCSFFSSLYPVRERAGPVNSVDAFVVTSNIIAIDLCSALFVVCGFIAAYAHANMTAADWWEFSKIVSLFVLVDLWLSTGVALLAGSVFHLARHTFRFEDVALTALTGTTGLRVLEFRQDWRAWHDLNPTGWVVPSLMYCVLLLPVSTRTNQRLRGLWSGGGDFLALGNAVLPITVIGLFALVRDDTNVFFANSANLGYRLFEFNLGTCLYTLSVRDGPAQRVLRKVLAVLQRVAGAVFFLFCMVWWSTLGTAAPPGVGETCVRMYTFSPCLKVHHGFLLRGCLLGITLVATVMEAPQPGPHLPTAQRRLGREHLAPVLSAALFLWPTCYVIELLLELNFSAELAHDYAMLLVFVVPHVALGAAFVWDETGKRKAFAAAERGLDALAARGAAWGAAWRGRWRRGGPWWRGGRAERAERGGPEERGSLAQGAACA